MSNELVVCIIELLEHHGVSSLVRMTLEGVPPERLLYHLPIRVQDTLLFDPQHGTQLLKLPIVEKCLMIVTPPPVFYSLPMSPMFNFFRMSPVCWPPLSLVSPLPIATLSHPHLPLSLVSPCHLSPCSLCQTCPLSPLSSGTLSPMSSVTLSPLLCPMVSPWSPVSPCLSLSPHLSLRTVSSLGFIRDMMLLTLALSWPASWCPLYFIPNLKINKKWCCNKVLSLFIIFYLKFSETIPNCQQI